MPGASLVPDGVLEVFLMGGLCPWDTFYVVPEYGRAEKRLWWTFQEGKDSVPEVFYDRCGVSSAEALTSPFGASDSSGVPIALGPWLQPLRSRPDILDRMRIVVMQHHLEPHEVATPVALCGLPRGLPRMSATGAHVQRHAQALAGGRVAPWAYNIFSSNTEIEAQFDIDAAAASGLHPASARPLQIRLAQNSASMTAQLRREHLGAARTSVDAAVQHYLDRYRTSLSGGRELVSRVVDDFAQARYSLGYGDHLAEIIKPELLVPITGSSACGSTTDFDSTATGLRLGTHLLRHAESPARHVTYIDSGLVNAMGAGYDSHDYHVVESSRNVFHLARTLAATINNKPAGEADPAKLDLDRQMIVLATEFGRTPYPETGKPQGLDHWPFGYAVVLIGGPIRSRSVAGAIGPDGVATRAFTPAELRAALLMAQGIWPFTDESFAIGDIRGATSHEGAARILREQLLGIPAA